MTNTAELEAIGKRWLDGALNDARKGSDPCRKCHGATFSPCVGKTRDQLRTEIAREYEWWRLNHPDGGSYDGGVVTIVFTGMDAGAPCVTAEVFDHDSGSSIVLMQPAKKGFLGGWKTTGVARALGAAEPLPRIINGTAARYELGDLQLDVRRRLTGELRMLRIPHLDGPTGGKGYRVFVSADSVPRVTAIPGWPSS